MSRGLFIQASSVLLNPTLDQARIDAEIVEDPEGARSEWLGTFREDCAQFLEDALIDAAVVPGRKELPYVPRQAYAPFVDSSSGRHDAMCLSIAHPEKTQGSGATRLVVDRLLIQRPPFEPAAVVQRFAETLREFHLSRVTGDKYAIGWVEESFRKCGIAYVPSALDKSAIYCEALPLFAQGRVELLDVPRLLTELRMLERRPRSGGRGDVVDHPPKGAHDDAANSVCGALVLASGGDAPARYTAALFANVRDEGERIPFAMRYKLSTGRWPF